MALEQSWRWFGPNDPYTLKEIKQTGAVGIVSALHQIPVGEIWQENEIQKRTDIIESEGLKWSVVESLPVHENIKKRIGNYQQLIQNYKTSIRNIAKCGIDTICYNFMPVLDWSRTDLKVEFYDGTITSKFDSSVFTAFDLFILKRKNAEKDYTDEEIRSAENYFTSLSERGKQKLIETVLLGLPGSLEALSLEKFKDAVKEYEDISADILRENLISFIQEIIPTADEYKVNMAIHPDDPPWSLLGLPRVVGNKYDIEQIISGAESYSNGITLCTGSFGAGFNNNLVEMTEAFADRINFVHLRNLTRNSDGDFKEAYHLEGDIDLYGVMKVLLIEQKRRIESGRSDVRLPMRPDHGHLTIPEMDRKGIYPGYSLIGRMRGLAELRGLELGIIRSLNL